MTTLEFLSQDEEARRLYEERERALHDYVSDIEGAREEGGFAKATEIARKMLGKGSQVEDIADITGFSIEEIQKLQEEIQ